MTRKRRTEPGGRLILALGNPGARYRDTRHNIGWWLADRLARRWACGPLERCGPAAACGAQVDAAGGRTVRLCKPLTYMNRSGQALGELLAGEPAAGRRALDPAAHMLVLVDDVSLPPGQIRLRRRGSPGGHNGLKSISARLGSDAYGRLRLGVGRPADRRIDLAAWVLAPMPAADEEAALGAFPRAVEAVECWLERGAEAAMNRFN